MRRKEYACIECIHGIRSERSEYGWECTLGVAMKCQPWGAALMLATIPGKYTGEPCRGCGGPVPPTKASGGPPKVFCSLLCGKRYRSKLRPSGGARKQMAKVERILRGK